MRRILLHLVGVGVFLAGLAPATALAHGLSGEFFAVVTSAILVLHTASIAGAILCLRRRLSWPAAGVAVLIAAGGETAWWLWFLQFTDSPAAITAASIWLFWFWLLAPFVLLVLSGASLLVRHYSKRAV